MLRVFDLEAMEDVLARANGRRGAAVVWELLGDLDDDPGLTASDLEERFLGLCRANGLPEPEINQWIEVDDDAPLKADFVWRDQKLIVEIDGWGSHGTRRQFETDRKRDQRARLAGWETIRFTARQLRREPNRVVATTAALLAR